MKKANLITLFFLISVSLSVGQSLTGQLIITNVSSPSLSNNIIGDPAERQIAIYLPPSYATTENHYPVVYFLVGHSGNINVFLSGEIQGYNLKTSMDGLINAAKIKEMIFVLLDGENLMDGSFFENSPVTGNWRDWITIDIVSYIDNNYRTIPKREARAICGHSMGGFGAVNIGMRNSDKFGLVYALSPGLYDSSGLKDQGTFPNETTIRSYLKKMDEWKKMEKPAALTAFKSYINSNSNSGNWFTCFTYGYGAAFSPDPDGYPPFVKYPYYLENDTLKCDSTYLHNYENGFGGLAEEVVTFKDSFLSLIDFTLDYGTNDYFQWICRGCRYMSQLLTNENIPHQLVSFTGDHSDKLRSRIEQFMLPRLSEKLQFESSTTRIKDGKSTLYDFELFQNYPNPFNPTTLISFAVPDNGHYSLKLYNILGQEITTLVNGQFGSGQYSFNFDAGNLSTGTYLYSLEGDNVKISKKMSFMK